KPRPVIGDIWPLGCRGWLDGQERDLRRRSPLATVPGSRVAKSGDPSQGGAPTKTHGSRRRDARTNGGGREGESDHRLPHPLQRSHEPDPPITRESISRVVAIRDESHWTVDSKSI